MLQNEYKNTYKYLHRYGNKVVVAIKNRIRKDKLIDTGELLDSINYQINDSNGSFQVVFNIGDGDFTPGSGLPSEYGVYLDKGTRYIDPYYFFTAPIPGLTQKDFIADITIAMQKDIVIFLQKQIKTVKNK